MMQVKNDLRCLRQKTGEHASYFKHERATITKIDRRNLMPKRTMVSDYSFQTSETEQYHFFFPFVSFLVKGPYVIFSISNFTVTFQNFDILKFVKRLCTAFKTFHVKNICIMTSECIS